MLFVYTFLYLRIVIKKQLTAETENSIYLSFREAETDCEFGLSPDGDISAVVELLL